MRISLIGPGRAGLALARSWKAAGHTIAAVVARRPEAAADAAETLATEALLIGDPLPESDLAVLSVRDDAIEEVAEAVASSAAAIGAAVHVSGLATLGALDALRSAGLAVGSFHPLQTLPTPEIGARRLAGAWVAVTASDPALRADLFSLAQSMDAHPFDLGDDAKALYHAAAAAAANFPLVALTMASDLFDKADVPFAAAEPLVTAVVANAFELGPRSALTGPVARGDLGTVSRQIAAVAAAAPEWEPVFRKLVASLADITGRREQFAHLVGEDRE